jgi:hypothetical protein
MQVTAIKDQKRRGDTNERGLAMSRGARGFTHLCQTDAKAGDIGDQPANLDCVCQSTGGPGRMQRRRGIEIAAEDLAHFSPYPTNRVKRFGEYPARTSTEIPPPNKQLPPRRPTPVAHAAQTQLSSVAW